MAEMTVDHMLREQALRYAVQSGTHGISPKDVVDRSEAYYEFLKGKELFPPMQQGMAPKSR